MSRYSSYRSPYLDSSYTSSSGYTSSAGYSTFSHPSYESKFESVISRNPEGSARSRAGTSTKYDYLSSYTSPVLSKYDKSPAYQSNSYASVINTDDLTRSYFEKYYSKPNTAPSSSALSSILDTSTSTTPTRTSRAFSVYLEAEDKPSITTRRTSLIPETRTNRSASVIADSISSPACEAVRTRFNRTLSVYDDSKAPVETTSSLITNGTTEDDKSSAYSSGYTRYSARIRDSSPPASTARVRDKSPPVYRSETRTREKSPTSTSQRTYGGTSTYSRLAERHTDSDEAPSSRYSAVGGRYNGLTNGYSNGSEKEDSPQRGSDSDSGCSGLRNIGNTCFMNSVIQCLSNTKQLTNYLLKDEHVREINTSNSSMKGSLIKAFATVIKSLWKGGGRIVDPSSLKGAVNRFAPRFSGYNQEDSQEFLRYLLEGLHEDVNRVMTKPQPINSEIDSSLSVCEQAMEAWKRYLRRDDSHLVDLFVGQLKSTLRCSDCGYESVTFEPFWDLSLGIPSKSGEVSLMDCLDSFTREEVLDGDEMPTCEQCKTRKKCSKRYSLYRLPKILVIHLKRFSPTERLRQKLSTTVTFPLTGLSLSRYADSVSASCTYNCYAVSNHSGTLYSGHYTAYGKHPQSGQWYSFNDSRVSKCSSSGVMSNENYLLFFELS